MSGLVDVGARGFREIDSRLAVVQRSLDDWSQVWPHVGRWWAAREEGIFARGGRPKWKPLRASYIARRRSAGLSGHILVRTGALKRALTSAQPAKSTRSYAVFGPAGRTAPYWTLHKYGTSSMPARNPLPGFTRSERDQVRTIMAQRVQKVIDR